MVCCRLGVFLEVALLDFLPAGHDASASAYGDSVPRFVEIGVSYRADKSGVTREGDEIVAIKFVIVVCHCVDEATDDSFCDIYVIDMSIFRVIADCRCE